ncbi:hypothetical protein DPEC_G00032200 [Dallia pectoralis]|uniref:Uncharacterized protein n=1 Tax=Dallia pectoralis TaxID=75939 RepID=A0ACC2HCJ4_DALPE|nr:hypothetical protein DPEC_G00032200 [Dallia pectoralis]
MQLDATLSWEQQSLQLSALVDSGADENFLDSNLVSQAGIPVEVLPAPLNAHALNGELLARGSRSVEDYAVEFRITAAETGWNDEALQGAFKNGLCERLKDELAPREDSGDLNELITLVIRLIVASVSVRKERAVLRLHPLVSQVPERESPFSSGSLSPPVTPPPTVRQRNPCTWVGPVSLQRSAHGECKREFVSTVVRTATTSPLAPFDQKSRLASDIGSSGEPSPFSLYSSAPHAVGRDS